MKIKKSKTKVIKKIILFSAIFIAIAGVFTTYFIYNRKTPVQLPAEQPELESTVEQIDLTKEDTKFNEDTKVEKKGKEMEPVKSTIEPSKDYSNLYPNLYAKRPKTQVSPDKTIFLTFDDGPSERTAEVLDILKENNIKATFFVIGNKSNEAKNLMKRIVDEGHTIAPHSYTHNFKQIYASVEAFLDDFNKIYNLIYENTGVKPTIFRFAGGSKNSFNKNTYKDIIAEMTRRGFDYFDWNLSVGDAVRKTPTPAVTCISNVTKSSVKCNNGVVLMHDAAPKKTTVEALPGLIKELKSQGFSFDKLSNEIYPAEYSLIKPYA